METPLDVLSRAASFVHANEEERCRLLPVPLLEEGVFQKLAVGLGVELDSILNPKRPHKLIFDDTSPNQYSTSTLLASESDWSSLPFTNPATGPSIWPIKTLSFHQSIKP
ncbi:homeobox protein MSX [Sarotherodon galilaeus]